MGLRTSGMKRILDIMLRFRKIKHFIPTLRSEGPQWGPVDILCLSLYFFVSLFLYLVVCIDFWRSFAWPIIARMFFLI